MTFSDKPLIRVIKTLDYLGICADQCVCVMSLSKVKIYGNLTKVKRKN